MRIRFFIIGGVAIVVVVIGIASRTTNNGISKDSTAVRDATHATLASQSFVVTQTLPTQQTVSFTYNAPDRLQSVVSEDGKPKNADISIGNREFIVDPNDVSRYSQTVEGVKTGTDVLHQLLRLPVALVNADVKKKLSDNTYSFDFKDPTGGRFRGSVSIVNNRLDRITSTSGSTYVFKSYDSAPQVKTPVTKIDADPSTGLPLRSARDALEYPVTANATCGDAESSTTTTCVQHCTTSGAPTTICRNETTTTAARRD